MRGQKGSAALILMLVVLIAVVLVGAFLVYSKKINLSGSSAQSTPTVGPKSVLNATPSTGSQSSAQSQYQNPFSDQSPVASSNPFDTTNQNPFDNLK